MGVFFRFNSETPKTSHLHLHPAKTAGRMQAHDNMILKALFLALLIYFVLKTAARLIGAMQSGETHSRINREPPSDWEGDTRRRSYEEEDVEDAKFVDV